MKAHIIIFISSLKAFSKAQYLSFYWKAQIYAFLKTLFFCL